MISRAIAQVLVERGQFRARSDDYLDDWSAEVERVVAQFGAPAGTPVPDCLFSARLGRKHVAVVSVSGYAFRFLVLSRALYDVIPDPFAIADRFPPTFTAQGALPSLVWPEQPLPRRTVAELDAVFKAGDGPFLLGACQTLVDSGRIVLKRDVPDAKSCRDLWMLIPDSTRRQTLVATFAYSLDPGFNLAVMPAVPDTGVEGYLTEDQARDYPESRYERELQTAVEHGDQRTVDRLLARRTSAETLRLALWIVLSMAAFAIALRVISVM